MRIGVFAITTTPYATPQYLAALGQAAEERGFSSLWVPEHVVLFDQYASAYPYAEDGRIPVGGEGGMPDPFSTLAFLAATTSSIRLGTGVCLVPQRNPVYTAKEVATLDWLSGGRVDFGIGVGWLREEFGALNVPFDARGARTDEYLEVLRTLWCDEVSEHHGAFHDLPPCRQYPKPVQRPHPPIHVGGHSDAALRRVARRAQGWYGFNLSAEAVTERLAALDHHLAAADRRRDDVRVTICPYLVDAGPDAVQRYHDAGVDELVLMVFARDSDRMRTMLDGFVTSHLEPAARLGAR